MQTAMDIIRRRRVELLTGGAALEPENPVEAAAIVRLERHTAQWLAAGGAVFDSDMGAAWTLLGQVRDAAIAWATPASRFHKVDGVSRLVAESVHRWVASCGPDLAQVGNWWHWEIGVPHVLTDIGLLMGDALAPELVDDIDTFVGHFTGNPNVRTKMPALLETGANRADKAAIAVKHGALIRSAERVLEGSSAVVDCEGGGAHSLFAYVEGGDGLYRDGSYIQHTTLAYAGTYGLVTLSELADLMFLLSGTPWAVDAGEAAPFLDSVERCYSPFITDGFMMDCTRGRGVSRSFATDEHMGAVAAGAVARMATMLDIGSPYLSVYRGLVKGWLCRHPALPTEHLPLNRIGLLRELAADDTVAAAGPLEAHVQTADQERVVHRRAAWQASFSLSSCRRGRFEWGNGENQHGWYQGDGHVQLFTNSDRGAYSGNYWATSDPLHLPGVTNVVRAGGVREAPGTGIPAATASWAGGVGWNPMAEEDTDAAGSAVLAGSAPTIGTVGMDMEHREDGLAGVKSWFALEDFYVALGAGITGTLGHGVHTTIEARKLSDPEAGFMLAPGSGANGGWAHLDNVAGYVLIDAPGLAASRNERTGAWADINVDGSPDQLSDSYQLLHLNHGVDPVAASYGYSVHPGAPVDHMPELAANSGYTVLANTATAQAIEVPARQLVMANYFGAATLPTTSVGEMGADATAAVVLGKVGEKLLKISISDPAQREKPVTLTVQQVAVDLVDAPAGTTMRTGPGWFSVTVPTQGTRGHGQDILVRLARGA